MFSRLSSYMFINFSCSLKYWDVHNMYACRQKRQSSQLMKANIKKNHHTHILKIIIEIGSLPSIQNYDCTWFSLMVNCQLGLLQNDPVNTVLIFWMCIFVKNWDITEMKCSFLVYSPAGRMYQKTTFHDYLALM